MEHFIIGTAGHVDHGKTALIRALTGIDTDRLKEEKERGISIELGFALLTLPSGRRAGIVDVPGHEKFIKNMLAGAGGFDLVILVVAADEGVMPQTREHLDIIELLQVKKGVVVITKADLVEQEWLELIKEEIDELLKGTILENAPVATVSAVTGQGITDLLHLIDRVARMVQNRFETGTPRLPVDRLFTITGFGTVVTGTLLSGSLKVGDVVEIQPRGLNARVRSMQVHGNKAEKAGAGQRVALNLAGLDLEQIERGCVVAGLKSLTPSHRLDVRLLLLKNASKPLKNRTRIRFYLGTAETLGRVVLLDREELKPGAVTYAQLELEHQAVAAKGDRFVIRSYSPMLTIGGGTVIDPLPKRKHKRFRKEVLDALATREKGTPEELLGQYLAGNRQLPELSAVVAGTGLTPAKIKKAAANLSGTGELKQINSDGKAYLVLKHTYLSWADEIAELVHFYHQKYPLREGYPKEELRSRKFKQLNNKIFQLLLLEMEQDGLLRATPRAVSLPSFKPGPDPEQQIIITKFKKLLRDAAFLPPSWKELCRKLDLDETAGTELLQYLLRTGEMVKITDDLYFSGDVMVTARERLSAYLRTQGEITVGELRDLLQTSRKYALPLLEYFDREKITRRVGDKRLPGRAME